MQKKLSLKFAFSLVEILLALVVIGVVCAMTIPNLIQKQKEQRTVAALKKVYSTLTNAFTLAVQEEGTPDYWGLAGKDQASAQKIWDMLTPNLKVIKNCGTSISGCLPKVYKALDGDSISTDYDVNTAYAKGILADGTSIMVFNWDSGCTWIYGTSQIIKNVCGGIFVDINGRKPPNKYGVDVFGFHLAKNGIVPRGTRGDIVSFANYCINDNSGAKSYTNGGGCTAWVIYNENMDYLHCSGLSWTGKHKCD